MLWLTHQHLDDNRKTAKITFVIDECIFLLNASRRIFLLWTLHPKNFEISTVQFKGDEVEAPTSLYGCHVAIHDRKAYMWHGRAQRLYCYDPVVRTWSVIPTVGANPSGRYGSACVQSEDTLIVHGGFDEERLEQVRDTRRLRLDTMMWEIVQTHGDPPSVNDRHFAGVIIGRKMYVIADDVTHHWTLDLCTLIWSKVSVAEPLPATNEFIPFSVNDRLFIFGGQSSDQLPSNLLYRFDEDTGVWSQIIPCGSPPLERLSCSIVVIGSRVFIIDGCGRLEEDHMANLSEVSVLELDPSLFDHAARAVLVDEKNRSVCLDVLPAVISRQLISVRKEDKPTAFSAPSGNVPINRYI